MSKLSAFLNPAPIQEEKDVVVSKRFTDEDGNVVPFRIRSMSQEETCLLYTSDAADEL